MSAGSNLEVAMKHKSKTEVLVVGAGPVGMTVALLLARAGIKVQVIDEAERSTVRSYSCGLHPHSLTLFRELGIEEALERVGHRVDRIAFYDGAERKAEIDLSQLPV